MKKISSMVSHMGVIGLALLALMIATVVWLVERLVPDKLLVKS